MQRQVCRYLDVYIETRTYTYNGNQLTKVEDATTATSYTGGTNFVNGSTAATEYTYDNNGNLTKDLNKGISSIQYNSLNLPTQVLFDNGATQTYHYTADGEKWRTVYTAGLLLKDTVDYCGGAIVENGVLKKLLTPVGYVDMSGSTPSYYYYLKDHQGNNRVVVNSSGSVVETNHYYPFGGLFATNGSVQDYKYNGKEWDDKTKWYDYGARHYDATLARWHVIDPLAEKYYSTSAYSYCYNNPIRFIDVLGMDVKPYGENEFIMIQNTLSDNERKYVRIDEQGHIDKVLLNSCNSQSVNFSALKELVNSDLLIFVKLDDSYSYIDNEGELHNKSMSYFESDEYFMDVNFEFTNGLTTGETGNNGITLLPGKGESGVNSVDDGTIGIVINDKLSDVGRAETYSHEANGHGLMYVRTRNREQSAHKYNGSEEMNVPLKELIINSRKETIKNLK